MAQSLETYKRRNNLWGHGYKNVHARRDFGELGEILFAQYLERNGINHEWINEDNMVRRNADFVINGKTWDIKVTTRGKRPAELVSVQRDRLHHTTNIYFWLQFYEHRMIMEFIGGLPYHSIQQFAKFIAPGEKLPGTNTTVNGSGLYDISTSLLLHIQDLI